ncbi:siderophore ABC transporter substrate-binding protein [Pseudooceanicola sp. CBS1P-1]|uniref:ABC transporter substrate-binding protein n=2 Tax=Paracoccaceae TaxID=31989 RepID=A0A6L7G2C6_9RHOB|nr:siderophore ABC transporter substrate-binding protein [Pseudooceanicola endophyticus]MXN18059.1 ABC transporter substrate-binding protein [Pseudooceanicola albus]
MGGVALPLACALAGPALAAEALTLETAKGPITLKAVPKTLVVLDVAAIDTLAALDVPMAGVATPLFVSALEKEVNDVPSVGTMFEADLEKVAALRPDLIITGLRAEAQNATLSRIAPVADMSIGDDAVADGLARLSAYAGLFDKAEQAESLKVLLQAKLDEAKAQVAKNGGKVMILLANGPKVTAFGADSRFGWINSNLDWPQAVQGLEASRHGEPVSFEFIAQADPDTILVIDRGTTVGEGAQSAQQTLDNALVQGTKAWKTGKVVYLSTPEAYVGAGGVQSLMVTLDQITSALKGAQS